MAVCSEGHALQHAADELKSDYEIVLEAVSNYGGALEYKSDYEIVLTALQSDENEGNVENSLEFAAVELTYDPDFVLAAVRRNLTIVLEWTEIWP